MANPAAITVTLLTANGATSLPTAQTIDTDGVVPILAGGNMDRLILEVVNGDDAALTVTIKAGDNPPSPLGQDLAVSLAATGGGATASRMIGPFESARFMQDDGSVNVDFDAATGTPSATVRCYRLPKT